MSFRLLIIAALFALLIPLVAATPGVYGEGGDNLSTPPENTELKYPNLGAEAGQSVAWVDTEEPTFGDAAPAAPVRQRLAQPPSPGATLTGNVARQRRHRPGSPDRPLQRHRRRQLDQKRQLAERRSHRPIVWRYY